MRGWLAAAAFSGFTAVALGAWGAHGLDGRLDAVAMGWFDTASRYHLFHALALFGVALLAERQGGLALRLAGGGFAVGTVVFCGLLYAMALGAPRWLGAVVPLGGVAFLAGWAALGICAVRMRRVG